MHLKHLFSNDINDMRETVYPGLPLISVATEADFCSPAGAGAPAHKLQRTPAGDEAPVIPLLHPEAPVKTRVPVVSGAPTYFLY